jgi:multiple sugar transport system substrate-binding protein
MNRRDFLRYTAIAAGSGFLAACVAPPAGTASQAPAASTAAVAAADDTWRTGLVAPDLTADFRMMSWEGEGEMRKWLLQIDKFFESYYPNVNHTIDWGVAWGDYWTKLPTLLAGGSPLEMVWMHDTRVKTFASRDFLVPLDDYLASYTPPGWPEQFYQSQVDAFKWNGKQYAFPYDWAPGGFYINQDLFEEAGLDLPTEETTWDEILEMAIKLTRDTDDVQNAVWGLGNVGTGNWSAGSYWIVKSFGGDFWTPDLSKSMMADPKTIEAFQFLRDLEWKHGVKPTTAMIQGLGLDGETAFASGKIAMHWGLNDIAFRLNEAIQGKFKWTVAPSPTGPAGRYQFSGGSAWAIPSTSEQKDLAFELIRYVLSNPEILPTTATMGGALVANKEFAEFGLPPAELGISDAFQHAFIDLGARDASYPDYHEKFLEWEATVYGKNLDPIWAGEVEDVTAALTQADVETQEILDSMKQ